VSSDLDWKKMRGLLLHSYKLVATKRMLAQLTT